MIVANFSDLQQPESTCITSEMPGTSSNSFVTPRTSARSEQSTTPYPIKIDVSSTISEIPGPSSAPQLTTPNSTEGSSIEPIYLFESHCHTTENVPKNMPARTPTGNFHFVGVINKF